MTKRFSVTFDDGIFQKLVDVSKNSGMTKSHVLQSDFMKTTRHQDDSQPLTPTEFGVLAESLDQVSNALSRIGNNLNQYQRILNVEAQNNKIDPVDLASYSKALESSFGLYKILIEQVQHLRKQLSNEYH